MYSASQTFCVKALQNNSALFATQQWHIEGYLLSVYDLHLTSVYLSKQYDKHFCSLPLKLVPGFVMHFSKHFSRTV